MQQQNKLIFFRILRRKARVITFWKEEFKIVQEFHYFTRGLFN